MYMPVFTDRYGYGFKQLYDMNEDIIDLNTESYTTVVNDIQRFWNKEKEYKEHGFSYRRGVLMYGPQGCGKSFLIKRLCRELILKHNGIGILVQDPSTYSEAVQTLKKMEPNTRLIAIFEDFDQLLKMYNESKYLQIFDGIATIDNVVNIVTSNEPQVFHERIVNRPSRFDIRCAIELPNDRDKSIFLRQLGKKDLSKTRADQWAEMSPNFTYAHLKELYLSVHVLGYEVEETVKRLKDMFKVPRVSKIEAPVNSMGYGAQSGS